MTLNERLKEIEERRDKAHREICDLASGKRKWEMCIPPQATDSDMTLQAPLDDLALLLAVVKELRAALDGIANIQNLDWPDRIYAAQAIARQALKRCEEVG